MLLFAGHLVCTTVDRVLAWMACRALGETDLNPVSGVSKLTQVCQVAAFP